MTGGKYAVGTRHGRYTVIEAVTSKQKRVRCDCGRRAEWRQLAERARECAGAGTLGVACIAEGRRALLGDRDAAHVEIAAKRLRSCPGEQRRLSLDVDAKPMTQALLETFNR